MGEFSRKKIEFSFFYIFVIQIIKNQDMKKSILFFSSVSLCLGLMAQKKVLDHTVYDSWKKIDRTNLSKDSRFISYEINPQKGDGVLIVQKNNGDSLLKVERGSNLNFLDNAHFATYTVKAYTDSVRMAKLNKVKKDMMPQDTLYMVNLQTLQKEQLPLKSSVQSTSEAPYVFIKKEVVIPKDTADKKSKEKKFQQLVVRNLQTRDSILIDSIGQFTYDKKGRFLLYSIEGDSTKNVFVTDYKKHIPLFTSKTGKISRLSLDESGNQGALLATSDTAKTAVPRLFYFDTADFNSRKFKSSTYKPKEILVTEGEKIPKGYGLSPNALSFSKEGTRLHFSYAELPKKEEKDTLLAEEKFLLDLWSTSDTLNMPQQIANKNQLINPSYNAVFFPKENRWMPVTDMRYGQINFAPDETKAKYALSIDTEPYLKDMNWEYPYPRDLYLVDLKSGKRELISQGEMLGYPTMLNPDGNFVVYFNKNKKAWYAFNTNTRKEIEISTGIEVPLFDESNDRPELPDSYGYAGFTKDMNHILIYDKYDLWSLDLSGKTAPVCLTKGWGRKYNTRLRLINLKDDNYKNLVDTNENILLSSFNDQTKENGFYELTPNGQIEKLIEGPYQFTLRGKAENGKKILFTRENFNEFSDLWVTDRTFKKPLKITHANPQMSEYKWGSVELMKWHDFNGDEIEGLLYKPENYDPNKKYPVIVYFYETHTEDLYKHHYPQPSWSIIIPPMFTSDDYVVFMPDIKYKTGYPGESCYNSVVSGANALIERGIADPARMGLQGQSWGGYQIAYLVTRTNMFACASPGAPVSNMTSAYSGIRTGSGLVRMFQYEKGQSRIGEDLWSAPMRYIENSPVFYAPQVNTPLLIRHDDADEAVPFEQGIEFFMALKRCGKTAWMLNYNNEPHNLRSRPARMDWSIRMHQFFDYYLKNKPMPRWMKEGITIKEKGKDLKYDPAS